MHLSECFLPTIFGPWFRTIAPYQEEDHGDSEFQEEVGCKVYNCLMASCNKQLSTYTVCHGISHAILLNNRSEHNSIELVTPLTIE